MERTLTGTACTTAFAIEAHSVRISALSSSLDREACIRRCQRGHLVLGPSAPEKPKINLEGQRVQYPRHDVRKTT